MSYVCGGYPEYYEAGDDRYDNVKEKISYAVIKAICANADLVYKEIDHYDDTDTVDVSIRSKTLPDDSGRIELTPFVHLQVKCTSSPNYNATGEFLSYSIDVDNYRDLIKKSRTPFLFVVMVLPKDVPSWIVVSKECLVIKKCIHWCNPSALDITLKPDQKHVTIRVPVSNVLDMHTLYQILDKASKGEMIPNEI